MPMTTVAIRQGDVYPPISIHRSESQHGVSYVAPVDLTDVDVFQTVFNHRSGRTRIRRPARIMDAKRGYVHWPPRLGRGRSTIELEMYFNDGHVEVLCFEVDVHGEGPSRS